MKLEEFNLKYIYTTDDYLWGFSDVLEVMSPNSEEYINKHNLLNIKNKELINA